MSGMVGYLLFNGLIGNAFHVLSVQLTYRIWILKHVESERFGSAEQFLFWPSISFLSRFQTRIKPVVITMKFNRDKSNTGSSPSKNFAAGLPRGYGTIPPQWRRKRKWKPWGTMASIRFDFEGIKREVTFYVSCLSNFCCVYNLKFSYHFNVQLIIIEQSKIRRSTLVWPLVLHTKKIVFIIFLENYL